MSENENEEPKRCIATTKSGNRCQMNAVSGSDYCVNPSHGPSESDDSETEESQEEGNDVEEMNEEIIEVDENFDEDFDILHNVEESDVIVEYPQSIVWQVDTLNPDGSVEVELLSDEDPIEQLKTGDVSRWCHNEVNTGISEGDLVAYSHPELADN